MKITHDIHTHSLFSSCSFDPEATVRNCIDKARELGHTVFGISNHVWDEKVAGASNWYKGQTIDYIFEGKYAIPEDTKGLKVVFGCETEYSGMSNTLGMLAETARRFDYVIIPHTHTHMKNFVVAEHPDVKAKREQLIDELQDKYPYITRDIATRMIGTLKYNEVLAMIDDISVSNNKYLSDFCFTSFESLLEHPELIKMAAETPTIIAHPFYPCGEAKEDLWDALGYFDNDRLYADFSKAAKMDIAMDINIGTYKMPENGFMDDPMVKVMRVAKAAGCKFAFGTDSHSVKGLEAIRKGDAISEAIGITEADIIDIAK